MIKKKGDFKSCSGNTFQKTGQKYSLLNTVKHCLFFYPTAWKQLGTESSCWSLWKGMFWVVFPGVYSWCTKCFVLLRGLSRGRPVQYQDSSTTMPCSKACIYFYFFKICVFYFTKRNLSGLKTSFTRVPLPRLAKKNKTASMMASHMFMLFMPELLMHIHTISETVCQTFWWQHAWPSFYLVVFIKNLESGLVHWLHFISNHFYPFSKDDIISGWCSLMALYQL